MDAIETFEHKGKTIEIHQDEDARDPREYGDNLDIMICFHKRYNLGDKHDYHFQDFNSWDELEAKIIKDHDPIAILPLYLLDHSGLRMNTTGFADCDPQGWDWGMIGFCFIPRKAMLKEWGMKHTSKKLIAKAESIIKGSVEVYDQYISGETYCYIIKDDNDNVVDSCGGFIGDVEYVKNEAKNAIL